MSHIPTDLLFLITSFLNLDGAASIIRVCKNWNELASFESFWQQQYATYLNFELESFTIAVQSQTGREQKITLAKISKIKQQMQKHNIRQFEGKKVTTSTPSSYMMTLKACALGHLFTKTKAQLEKQLQTNVSTYQGLVNKHQLIKSYASRLLIDKEKAAYLMPKLPIMYTLVIDISLTLRSLKGAERNFIIPILNDFFKSHATYCVEHLKTNLDMKCFQAILKHKLEFDMIAFAIPHFKTYMDSIIPITSSVVFHTHTPLLCCLLDRNAPQPLIELALESGLCHPKYNQAMSTSEIERNTSTEADIMFDGPESYLLKALKNNRIDTYEYLLNRWKARYTMTPYEVIKGIHALNSKPTMMRFIKDYRNQMQQVQNMSTLLDLRCALFALVLSSARVIREDTVPLLRSLYQEGISFDTEIYLRSNTTLMDVYTQTRFSPSITTSWEKETPEFRAIGQAAEEEALRLIITEFNFDVNQVLQSGTTLLGELLTNHFHSYKIIKLILESGADLDFIDSNNCHVLHHCGCLDAENFLDFLETALRMGVKEETINTVSSGGSTVLDIINNLFSEETTEKAINLFRKHGIEPQAYWT